MAPWDPRGVPLPPPELTPPLEGVIPPLLTRMAPSRGLLLPLPPLPPEVVPPPTNPATKLALPVALWVLEALRKG